MGCVALSLGKSSLIDTKHSFIRLTRVSISPPVNAFAKRSISCWPPGELPSIVFTCFHQFRDDVASIEAILDW
jgi:hypothetical protein